MLLSMKYTKEHIKIENTFNKEIVPLLDKISDLCEKHNLPMLSAFQLFEDTEQGARLATKTFSNAKSSVPLLLCSSVLEGTAKVVLIGNSSFSVTLPDDTGNHEEIYDENDLETLEAHAEHCQSCSESLGRHLDNGEDLSTVHVIKHADDEYDDLPDDLTLPIIISKNPTIH